LEIAADQDSVDHSKRDAKKESASAANCRPVPRSRDHLWSIPSANISKVNKHHVRSCVTIAGIMGGLKMQNKTATFALMLVMSILASSVASAAKKNTSIGHTVAVALCKAKLKECNNCTISPVTCINICREAKQLCFPSSAKSSPTAQPVKDTAKNRTGRLEKTGSSGAATTSDLKTQKQSSGKR
jgi:hypothetical protein